MPTDADILKDHLDRGDTTAALAATTDERLRVSLLLELGRYDEALDALGAACQAHRRSTRLWFARAHLAQKMGRLDVAEAAYDHLRRLRPRDETICRLMRAWYESRGETFLN